MVTKWVPEKDASILRRVGKLGEECTELAKVCLRITIQGIFGVNPTSGKTNITELEEECADVLAQVQLTIEKFDLNTVNIAERLLAKRRSMEIWEKLSEEP